MARDRTLGLKLRAIDKMSAVITRIQKTFPKLTRSIRRASRATKIFNSQTKRMRANLNKLGSGLKRFGLGLSIGITAPIAALGVAAVKTFVSFEQGLIDVKKTTGLALPVIEKLIVSLGKTLPVPVERLLGLAAAAGNVGVKGTKDIKKFTETMAKLEKTTDIAGDEGARALVGLLKVTGESITVIDRFASALVDLGNNSAATEAQIFPMAVRVGQATASFKLGGAAVLGISTAMASLQIRAEAGGTVIGKTFRKFESAIRKGGKSIIALQKITGLTSKILKKTFKEDPVKIFRAFLKGLARLKKENISTNGALEDFGLIGDRVSAILPLLVQNVGLVEEKLNRSAKAWKENIALNEEFKEQQKGLGAAIQLVANRLVFVKKAIAVVLIPAIRSVLTKINEWSDAFLALQPLTRKVIVVLAIMAAALGPLLITLGFIVTSLAGLAVALIAVSVAGTPLAATLLTLLSPILLVTAAVISIIAIGAFLIIQWKEIKSFFNENPFARFMKFIFLVLTPLGQLITFVRLVIAAFEGLDAVKGVIRSTLPKSLGNFILGEQAKPFDRLPQGPQSTQPVNGQISVDFNQMPPGTNVRAKTSGPLDFGLSLGFLGAIQ